MTFERSHMENVAKSWQASVVDFTKRNNLLFFKPRTSNLDLANAQPQEINNLLAGNPASLKQLVNPIQYEESQKVVMKLQAKQKYLLEELGVSPLFIAIGFCSWVEAEASGNSPEEQTTNAPVFLLQIEIENKRSNQDGWRLRPTADLKINGVLTHVAASSGIKFDEDSIFKNLPEVITLDDLLQNLDLLADTLGKLEGFKTSNHVYLSAFGYQDEAIYRDLTDIDALLESEIVRALAGDSGAIAELQKDLSLNLSAPDYVEPALENLILDADSSQIEAINSALAGRNLVVEGPPGTGKSQTIANMLAECMAQGKRVLFVAQKRAAITAVLSRLKSRGLDILVLDVHDASRGPQVAAQIADSYENMRSAQQVDLQNIHEELKQARDKLVGLRETVFTEVRGLGLTLYQLQDYYHAVEPEKRPQWRLEASVLESLTNQDFMIAIKSVRQAVESQGLRKNFDSRSNSWNVNTIRTADDVSLLSTTALNFVNKQLRALENLPLANNSTISVAEFYRNVITYLLTMWLSQNAPKLLGKSIDGSDIEIGLAIYGKLNYKAPILKKLQVRIKTAFAAPRDKSLRFQAFTYLRRLRDEGTGAAPSKSDERITNLDELIECADNFQQLLAGTQGVQLESTSTKEFARHILELAKDPSQYLIAKYWEAYDALARLNLLDALLELGKIDSEGSLTADEAEGIFKAAIAGTLIEKTLIDDERVRGLDSQTLENITRSFQKYDRAHLRQNAEKILRLAGENFRVAINEHVQEHQYLQNEAAKKRAHKPLRELIRRAPNLMLAANPVWAMSPIQVASLLPRTKLFDIIIFDEASQIRPEMAIPSIIRGKSAVIAGDSNQLPPTNFFSGAGLSQSEGEEDDSEQRIDGSVIDDTIRDSESILEAVERVVGAGKKRLLWHYRSRDERLIALSNLEIYGNSLTTFPASDTPDALNHVLVSKDSNRSVVTASQNSEVRKVIELIQQHSKMHPAESLGVITFGIKHLSKIEMALAQARRDDKQLDSWLDDKGDEGFFLKNLERVQGDERDAIIISTGYGRDESGKMSLRWGPLTSIEGRRRLNVAISRAKRRMTLVTNFTFADLAQVSIKPGTGVELFMFFLEYISNDGANYRNSSNVTPLNGFELDIKRQLEAQGLNLVPQFGVCNYRIDFAVRHPQHSDSFVLAIEADGASYHSGHIARERDRLRQMLLEERGWKFHRIWSSDWFRSPQEEVKKVLNAYQSALEGEASESESYLDEDIVAGTGHVPSRSLPHPGFGDGRPIDEYTSHEIDSVVRYIISDGLLRTDDEIIEEASKSIFGYAKTGVRIKKRVQESIHRVMKG